MGAAPNASWMGREQSFHLLVEYSATTYCLDGIEYKFVAVFVSDYSHEKPNGAITA